MARKADDIATIPKNAYAARDHKRGRRKPNQNHGEDLVCPNCDRLVVNHPPVCSSRSTSFQYDSDLAAEKPVTCLTVMVYRGTLQLAAYEVEVARKPASASGKRQ